MKNFIPVNRPSFSSLEKKYILKCIKSGWVSSSGKFIEEFENSFKRIVSRKFAVAVTSGTAALDIAIKSLKLKPGDEIIVPNFTIISCVNEIIREGLKPIFIDADPITFNINPDLIEKKIGWSPLNNFSSSIKETIFWYLNNKNWWKNLIN